MPTHHSNSTNNRKFRYCDEQRMLSLTTINSSVIYFFFGFVVSFSLTPLWLAQNFIFILFLLHSLTHPLLVIIETVKAFIVKYTMNVLHCSVVRIISIENQMCTYISRKDQRSAIDFMIGKKSSRRQLLTVNMEKMGGKLTTTHRIINRNQTNEHISR